MRLNSDVEVNVMHRSTNSRKGSDRDLKINLLFKKQSCACH